MADQVIFLLVCTANVCRSPTAEILLNDALAETDATAVVRAVSAGVEAVDGEPTCAQARDRLGRASGEHASRLLTRADLEEASLVLALDRSHRSACARLDPGCRSRLFTLRQAALLAERLQRVLAEGGRPAGSPPLPAEPAERLHWLVAELDAARGALAGEPEEALDVVDRHGPEPHAEVVDEITEATSRLGAVVATVLAVDRG